MTSDIQKIIAELKKIESKGVLTDAAAAPVAAAPVAAAPGVASNALKGIKTNALISGGIAVYQAWTQIKALPADLPEDKRRIEVTRIVSKVVAETGLVLAGTVFGALVGGLFFGVGAIPGFFAGLLGGTIAQATLGDSVKELVDKIVDYLNETNPSVAGAAPAAQVTPGAVPPVGSKPAAPTLRPGADPKVAALQQKLLAQGANLGMTGPNKDGVDGFMGPKTQAAMQQFPTIRMEETIKDTKMTESEKIAALRNKLARLDEAIPIPGASVAANAAGQGIKKAGAGAWDAVKGMWQAGKTGLSGAPVATGKTLPSGAAQMTGQGSKQFQKALAAKPASQRAAYSTGKAIKANPVKTALGAAGAGAAAGYAMSGSSAAPAATPPVGSKPAASAGAKPAAGAKPQTAPASAANAAPDPKEVEELNTLAASLENSMDPQDIELMKQYNGVINAINNRAKGDKRTQGEIAASSALQGSGM